ncbi:hypothetical protein [Plantactinospora sp. KLBMP9567]|uniref:hypothetical protein n=1 Tax=Plantactinospora sp. KLBMP9567 TaxID=3085900 RepID=UPI002980BC27|nr:hypothetical protein [Plantactinospora sp. KLBMP9567]MDW5328446.1 hypothetical protein [Plantactinospora sp. KLBMP9567]
MTAAISAGVLAATGQPALAAAEDNTPPDVPTNLYLYPDLPCATAEPYPVLGTGDLYLFATSTDPDHSTGDLAVVWTTFALWPVDDPASRTETELGGYYSGTQTWTTMPATALQHGRTYAWAARARDEAGVTSAWSQACYFARDSEAPAQPPTVSSADYPDDDGWYGGIGIPGEFTFDANGDADVVGFGYGLKSALPQYVPADGPGGRATVTITPVDDGPNWITVYGMDEAGNRSPATSYYFRVNNTAPVIEGRLTEPGVATPITFRPGMPDVVEYRYHLDGEPEQTVAAGPDGTATVSLTDNRGGQRTLTVTSRTAAGLEATATRSFLVRTEPFVSSPDYPAGAASGGVGVPGVFTFTPRLPGVVRYRYTFLGQPQRVVDADSTGGASVTWTPTKAGQTLLSVRGIYPDGSSTAGTSYQFQVAVTPS